MKTIILSDTHCRLRKIDVPAGDLLLHAGDLTFKGDIKEISQELRELERISKNFTYGCVFIAGNHDRLAEQQPFLMKQMALDHGLTYLDHSSTVINGFNIFGSAYSPEFCNWSFGYDRAEAFKYWSEIPDNTHILITHGPPMGVLDSVIKFNSMKGEYVEEKVGCLDLYNRIQELKELKVHCFGHIHQNYGIQVFNKIYSVNASVCTENYRPINKPVVIEL